MKHILINLIVFCSLLCYQCKQKAVTVLADCQTDYCQTQSRVIKSVTNETGRVFYNQFEQRYMIIVSTGTYDSQDVGLLCDLPAEFRHDGLRIIFSGSYRAMCNRPPVFFAGQTYYYLQISTIRFKPTT